MTLPAGARRNAIVLDFSIGALAEDADEPAETTLTSDHEVLGTPADPARAPRGGLTPGSWSSPSSALKAPAGRAPSSVALGGVYVTLGRLRDSRDAAEHAIALHDPERHRQSGFVFGVDLAEQLARDLPAQIRPLR